MEKLKLSLLLHRPYGLNDKTLIKLTRSAGDCSVGKFASLLSTHKLKNIYATFCELAYKILI